MRLTRRHLLRAVFAMPFVGRVVARFVPDHGYYASLVTISEELMQASTVEAEAAVRAARIASDMDDDFDA